MGVTCVGFFFWFWTMKKTYGKPSLSPAKLLRRYHDRGLLILDESVALAYLNHVGAYRLKGLWFHLCDPDSKAFPPGTTFGDIIERYEFDQSLRKLTFEALGRIEVSIRATISNCLSEAHGPHWFSNGSLFTGQAGGFDHGALVDEITGDVARSRMTFIEHYREHYDKPRLPPSWAMSECMSFGFWSKTYKIIASPSNRDRIAKMYGIEQSSVFGSWLRALSYLRNLTYHHGRLLRAYLVFPVKSYKHIRLGPTQNQTFYAYATVIHHILTNTGLPTSWKADLQALFARYPGIDPRELGFEPGWAARPGW